MTQLAVVPHEEAASTHPVRATGESITRVLAVMADAEKFAERMAKSQFIPQAFRNNLADVMAAVTLGQMVGLNPMQALWGIAVINGRPALWGDAALAVVRSHPDFEDIIEAIEKDPNGEGTRAICTITRRGQSPVTRTFSMAQAKQAGLQGKKGPWTDYPARMLQMRARGFAMRDAFADALTGMILREEAEDIPAKDEVSEPRNVTPAPAAPEGQRMKIGTRGPGGEVVHAFGAELGLNEAERKQAIASMTGKDSAASVTHERWPAVQQAMRDAAARKQATTPNDSDPLALRLEISNAVADWTDERRAQFSATSSDGAFLTLDNVPHLTGAADLRAVLAEVEKRNQD